MKFVQDQGTWLENLFRGNMTGEKKMPIPYNQNCKVMFELTVKKKDILFEVMFENYFTRIMDEKNMFSADVVKKVGHVESGVEDEDNRVAVELALFNEDINKVGGKWHVEKANVFRT